MLEPNTEGYGIMDTVLRSDGSGMKHLHQKAGGSRMPPSAETVAKRLHYIHQEGAQVYKFAVAGMSEVTREIMARNNLTRRHDRLGGAAPGQPPHHRDDGRAARSAARAGDVHHPQIRQHHHGLDPALACGTTRTSSRSATGCCSPLSAAASPGAAPM